MTWWCSNCGYTNSETKDRCSYCGEPRPTEARDQQLIDPIRSMPAKSQEVSQKLDELQRRIDELVKTQDARSVSALVNQLRSEIYELREAFDTYRSGVEQLEGYLIISEPSIRMVNKDLVYQLAERMNDEQILWSFCTLFLGAVISSGIAATLSFGASDFSVWIGVSIVELLAAVLFGVLALRARKSTEAYKMKIDESLDERHRRSIPTRLRVSQVTEA